MRHLRSRRRLYMFLTAILAACATVFAEARIEAFAPQMRGFVETRAAEAFGGRVRIGIGEIAGGIVNPISFNDITVAAPASDAAVFASVVIESVRTNCRLWDLVRALRSGAGGAAKAAELLTRDASAVVRFGMPRGAGAGLVRLDGDLHAVRARGSVDVYGSRFVFDGRITRRYCALEFASGGGTLRVFGRICRSGRVVARFHADRFALRGIAVSGAARTATLPGTNSASPVLAGTIEAARLAVNGRAFPALACRYAVKDGTVAIERLTIGDVATVSGTVTAAAPHALALRAVIDNVTVTRLLGAFGAAESVANASGIVSARVTVTGTALAPRWEAHLEARQGSFSSLRFDGLSAVVTGEGPLGRFDDARIARQSGTITLSGEFDLRQIGRNIFFRDVRFSDGGTAMVWDGLTPTASRGNPSVRMEKSLPHGMRVGYTQRALSGPIDESARGADEARFEYALGDGDSIAMALQGGGGFIGVQHRDKF